MRVFMNRATNIIFEERPNGFLYDTAHGRLTEMTPEEYRRLDRRGILTGSLIREELI